LDEDLFSAKSSLMQAFMNENHTSVSTRMLNIPDSSYEGGVENYYISQPLTSSFTDTPVFAEPTIARRWGAMISTTCEDLDAALAYMDSFFATKENPLNEEGTIYNLSMWLGEEGVDWEWMEEGVSYKQAAKPDGWDVKNGFSGTPYIGKFHAMRYDSEGNVDLLPKGVLENCIPYATPIIRDDALSLTDDENDIFVEKYTDIQKYVGQMFTAFITGDADIDAEWDNYVQSLEEMGLQEVLDCYEAALARYNSWQES
jgi:putative aldouronate transport system substrate-binding protein